MLGTVCWHATSGLFVSRKHTSVRPPATSAAPRLRLALSTSLVSLAVAFGCGTSSAQPREVSRPGSEVLTLSQSLLPESLQASIVGPGLQLDRHSPAADDTARQSPDLPEAARAVGDGARVAGAEQDSQDPNGHPDASPLSRLSQAIASQDFELAAQLLSRTPAHAVGTPLHRLASARIALELGNADAAAEGLTGLEVALPEHRDLVAQWQLEALARGSRYRASLDAIYRSADFSLLLHTSQRLLEDKQLLQSQRFLNRAYGKAGGSVERGQIRLLRAQLLLAQGRVQPAETDLRWLAISNPHHPAAREAFDVLTSHPRMRPLRVEDHYARASRLAEAGLAEETERSLAAIQNANPQRYRPGDLAQLRGLALYRARRFAEAVPAFDQALRENAYKSDQARYLAARATSRAGNPKEAIERFTAISRMAPKTPNTQYALFRIGREWSLLGEWEAAAAAYTDFLNQLPNHEFAEVAERERVIAWFAMGEYQRAAFWFRRLRARDPQGSFASLYRAAEGLAMARLGHPDTALLVWKEVAQASPLSFAGMAARHRLRELGEAVPEPAEQAAVSPPMDFLLPLPVFELESLGLAREAAAALKSSEAALASLWAPRTDQAACQAHEQISDGRRRYELGASAVRRLDFGSNPQAFGAWLWQCYFPTPYRQWVSEHARTRDVSEALVYAVMRQESGFRARVKSPAGASGLMQIIDPTARRIAEELGRTYDPAHLDVPHHNIEYGSYYLGKLQSHFEHPALVAAAYNAGPDASARWAAAGRSLPLELFILRVPFDETRNYLQRVLVNLSTYLALYPEFERTEIPFEFQAPVTTGPAPRELVHRAPEDFY